MAFSARYRFAQALAPLDSLMETPPNWFRIRAFVSPDLPVETPRPLRVQTAELFVLYHFA